MAFVQSIKKYWYFDDLWIKLTRMEDVASRSEKKQQEISWTSAATYKGTVAYAYCKTQALGVLPICNGW